MASSWTAWLAARRAIVDAPVNKPASWWREHFGLVLDGVTLTKAPRPLSKRKKHAAQAIKHMWVKRGESLDNDLHTHNRYGVQLGDKVPLWGGFNGRGQFSLKLWTDSPKLDKAAWTGHNAKGVKRAARGRWLWHDNETVFVAAISVCGPRLVDEDVSTQQWGPQPH